MSEEQTKQSNSGRRKKSAETRDTAPAPASEPKTATQDGGNDTLAVKNTSPNRFRHAGLDLAPGESVTLPDHVLNNTKSLRIIDRQVAIGRMQYVG